MAPTTFVASVTRWWNKSIPIIKSCPISSSHGFFPLILSISNIAKNRQPFGILSKENLSPRSFKNSRIWSYWWSSFRFIEFIWKQLCSNANRKTQLLKPRPGVLFLSSSPFLLAWPLQDVFLGVLGL